MSRHVRQRPPRWVDQTLVLLVIVGYVTSFVMAGWIWIMPLPMLLGVAVWCRSGPAADLAVLCTVVALGTALLPVRFSMPGLALGLSAYALLAHVAHLRPQSAWLRRGTLHGYTPALIGATALVAGAALVAWVLLIESDPGHFAGLVPLGVAPWAIPVGVVMFAAANAAVEELVFRGAIMHATDQTFGYGAASVLVQAVAFGVWHMHGVPSGALGAGMVVVYGAMLGVVRRKADGLLAPWSAHILADVTIVVLLWMLG